MAPEVETIIPHEGGGSKGGVADSPGVGGATAIPALSRLEPQAMLEIRARNWTSPALSESPE